MRFAIPLYAEMVVQCLRCESADNPLGVDRPVPRFSWLLHDDRFNARQTASRILVASGPAFLKTFDTEQQKPTGLSEIA